MKPKLTTKNKTKTNQNHIVWKSVMVLFILLIIFLISGCSSSSSSTEETPTPTYTVQDLKIDNSLYLSQTEFEYKVMDSPTKNVANDSGSVLSLSDNSSVYNLTLKLSDLGINSSKEYNFSVEVQQN